MPIRILVADDHGVVRDGLKMILESAEDFDVIAMADDGIQAMLKARELKPDVIIMDISMKNMNGISSTERIKEELPEVKVVILSVQSSAEDIYRGLSAGASGYLLKESAGTEVIEAVKTVMTGRRYLSAKVDEILIDSYIHDRRKSEMSPLEQLSSREKEVLQLVAEGKSTNEIAKILFLSVKTIETYRSRLMQKLGLKEYADLVKFALKHGLID